ncbi:CoB--CoM heterodisulfide reductase [uncultured Desulfobacterium sp.]|uniref:CoB--CoM heterodisulfide reductase n=1 Tax=uncultured Desulfobacterium sp. TaxID=201089 RepID=A0A445MQU2_9BACT|nr:CoB--CoM heterodisulfide reductase [uncultured Desulfobacterium sp.]
MEHKIRMKLSYFPGCSLATSAKENNWSLIEICRKIGLKLIELEDWNCCGSSSAHSLNSRLALNLASRILSLAPPERPLLVACPSCNMRLRHAQHYLKENASARDEYQRLCGRPFDPYLKIMHFFELFDQIKLSDFCGKENHALNGLRFVPYYGCMLTRPPSMRREKNYYGLMENVLSSVGASPVQWSCASRCCGTFLSAAKPDFVAELVNNIVRSAHNAAAECIVTACAMCHLNLEIRCNMKDRIPVFHFSELLSLVLGSGFPKGWSSRHIVDPMPILKARELFL